MIYAMITICNMAAVSSCLFISDTYGPYNSIDECLNRVAEILRTQIVFCLENGMRDLFPVD